MSRSRLQNYLRVDSFPHKYISEMRCKLDSTENPRSFEKYPTPPGRVGVCSKERANFVESSLQSISSNSSLCKRTKWFLGIQRDLDTANLRPSLEQGCGKQAPIASILFFHTNLVYVLNINM